MTKVFMWDVYHIENYLLVEEFIAKVMKDYPSYARSMSVTEISAALKECAKDSVKPLLLHQMRTRVYGVFAQCLDLGFDPHIEDAAVGFGEAVGRVCERIRERAAGDFSVNKLKAMREELEASMARALLDGTWRSKFRGRDILGLFVGRYLKNLPYDAFRDAIVARMADANYRPPGMSAVIDSIMRD